MTEQRYTDGPWIFEDYSQEEPEFFVVPATYYGTVAKVYREDDARLIAAAPEMLEALKELADALDDGLCNSSTPDFDSGRLDRALTIARAAIAKATGQ